MGLQLIQWYFCQLVIKYAIRRDTPYSKADTLLRYAEREVVFEQGYPFLRIINYYIGWRREATALTRGQTMYICLIKIRTGMY